MTMKESTVERTVRQWAKDHGILVMKLAGPQQKGQPDRMFLYRGKVCFVEFKAPGKKPTALQMKWMNDLYKRGFKVGWFDNAPEAMKWIVNMIAPI